MNGLVKYVITNVSVNFAIAAIQRGLEIALVNIDPKQHEDYVDSTVASLEAKIDRFLARNTALVERFAPHSIDEEEDVDKSTDPSFDAVVNRLVDLVTNPQTEKKDDDA